MDDWGTHYLLQLGAMRNYTNSSVMDYHSRCGSALPTEPQTMRINQEIHDWPDVESLKAYAKQQN